MGWKLILALAALLIICGSIFLKRPAVIAISPDAIIASVVSFSNKAANATTSFISKTLPDTDTTPPSDPSADLLPQNPHARDDHEGVGNLNQSKGTTSQVLNHAGNIARKFIHKQENSKDPIDLELIYRKAEILSQQKRVTDAYLLYFYAAKSGNGNAAFQLARLADPATFKPHLSMMDAPDPIQANKWYLEAVRNGYPDANYKIEQFYFRLAAKATDGDEKTQRIILLLQK